MTAEKALLKCNHCNKEFKYDSERRRHEQSHFPQFQCKVCNKNFSFISAVRRHEKQHERTGSVTCDECGREFRDQVLLKRHAKYAHAGSHTCTKCDAVFSSDVALRTHMQTHKLESERRYKCSFEGCSKKFNFAHHLKHHELTHTNSKQHYCKVCGKGFIQSHHLKTHLKTHTDDTSLYCEFLDCHKKFATEYAKKRHVVKYHIKTDSGISSDSNSACDVTPSVIQTEPYEDGIDTSTRIEHETNPSNHTYKIEFDESPMQDYSTQEIHVKFNTEDIEKNYEINNCKAVLGECIMNEEDKCVCIKMNKNEDNNYDFTPIDVETINIDKLVIDTEKCKSNCCGGACGLNENNNVPDIDYRIDGTVKIKEFMNMDDEIKYSTDRNSNVMNFVPFNSCKDILGKCIVSGNGTIDDGCLCARMIDNEQVTAQEIEDITPHPMSRANVI